MVNYILIHRQYVVLVFFEICGVGVLNDMWWWYSLRYVELVFFAICGSGVLYKHVVVLFTICGGGIL